MLEGGTAGRRSVRGGDVETGGVPSMSSGGSRSSSGRGGLFSQLSALSPVQRTLLLAVVGVAVLLLVFAVPTFVAGGSVFGSSPVIPSAMRIAIITDLDQSSRDGESPSWTSYYRKGWLRYDQPTKAFSISWDEEPIVLRSAHSEAGRGMELSDLVVFNNRMYTFDDRSGIVFEVDGYESSTPHVYPRFILMEGDGDTDKGFKCEWATVKDGEMYIGSFGKEYTNNDGTIKNRNNNWVKVISSDGRLKHVDWTERFEFMRSSLGYEYPAYILHETGIWSEHLRKWVFLPRRMSKEPYDDTVDEKKGANTIIVVDEHFTSLEHRTVGTLTPERGFSSAKFVPGSNDQIILALKSEENAAAGTQASYISLFTVEGEMLLDEAKIPGSYKYEGLEFI